MPTYEYYCVECQFIFEQAFKKYEDSTCPCPKCGSTSDRKPSAPNIYRSGTSRESIDTIIGRESEKRWVEIKSRREENDKIRQESGQVALSRKETQIDGKITYKYEPVSKERIAERKDLYSDYEKNRKKS
jgi:putative FmdB family regulatory protein